MYGTLDHLTDTMSAFGLLTIISLSIWSPSHSLQPVQRGHPSFTTIMIRSYFALLSSKLRVSRAQCRRRGSLLASIDVTIQAMSSILGRGVQQAFHRTRYSILPPASRLSITVKTCEKRLSPHSAWHRRERGSNTEGFSRCFRSMASSAP